MLRLRRKAEAGVEVENRVVCKQIERVAAPLPLGEHRLHQPPAQPPAAPSLAGHDRAELDVKPAAAPVEKGDFVDRDIGADGVSLRENVGLIVPAYAVDVNLKGPLRQLMKALEQFRLAGYAAAEPVGPAAYADGFAAVWHGYPP